MASRGYLLIMTYMLPSVAFTIPRTSRTSAVSTFAGFASAMVVEVRDEGEARDAYR